MGKKKESSFYRSTGGEKNRTECLQILTRPPLLTSTSRRPEERLVLPPLSLQRLVPSVFPQRRSETRSPPRPRRTGWDSRRPCSSPCRTVRRPFLSSQAPVPWSSELSRSP